MNRSIRTVLALLGFALGLSVQASEPDTALMVRIDTLVERIGNPVIRDAADLDGVRHLCDSCMYAARDIRTDNPALDAAASTLYDVAYQIGNAFLEQQYEPAGSEFMLAAPGLSPSDRISIVRIMSEEYARVKTLLTDTMGIQPPEGRVVVLVPVRISDEFTEMLEWDRDRIGAITALCKWVMTPVEVTRGSEMKEGYPQLREYLRHELTHVFVNSASGTRKSRARPTWFDEMVTTNAVGTRRGLALSYKEYLALGRHLRRRFGDQKYYEFVRRVIETGSAEGALRDLFGYESYAALKADFSRTARKRDLRWWAVALGALVALIAFVYINKALRRRNEFRARLAAARAAWAGGKWHDAVEGYDLLGHERYDRFLSAAMRAERAERRPAALAREFEELMHQAGAAYNTKDFEHTFQLCGTLMSERFDTCRPEKAEHRIRDLWISSEFRATLRRARKAYDDGDWLDAADGYEELQDDKYDAVRSLARDGEVEARARESRAKAFESLLAGMLEAIAAGDREKAAEHAHELSGEEYADLLPKEERDRVDEYADEYEEPEEEDEE